MYIFGRERVDAPSDSGWLSAIALFPGLVVATGAGPQLPRLFFGQFEIIGSTMGSYIEFAELTALVAGGLPVFVDEVVPLADYPAALERLEHGEQLGKIVLRH